MADVALSAKCKVPFSRAAEGWSRVTVTSAGQRKMSSM
jgi:hypothetical protein